VTVLIVDGSATPWFLGEQLKDLLRVTYHHLPRIGNEEVWGNYCRRMREASLLPVTRYSAVCADDDSFTISGILAILKTLEIDPTVWSDLSTSRQPRRSPDARRRAPL